MVHPIAEADEHGPFGKYTEEEFYARHAVTHGSEFITNPRGLKIFTQWWTPLPPTKITGVIALVHGFSGESSGIVGLTGVHFAKSGFAVCAADHQGHGFSDGLRAHIPDINTVVDDCISFFGSFRDRYSPSLPSFLYSESLGGAISLLITLRRENRPWDGLVLSGAMCGISAKFKPPWPLEHLLSIVAAIVPTWKVIPTRGDIYRISFKEEYKLKLAVNSPRSYTDRPRAATARELIRTCDEIRARMEEVDVPLLIVHGADDVVCDPACVEELYQRASSKDKTLKIYPGVWHAMVGEPEESVEMVFGDIMEWLKTRVSCAAAAE